MIMAMWKNLMWKTERFSLKNWCFQTVVLEKTLESPLDHKEIKLVNPKGNQPWVFIERPDAEAEAPILWPPDARSQLIGEDPGKDWRQKEKGTTEDEMVGWHHWFNGHEFEQAPGDSEGQGILECCSSWGSQIVGHDLVTEHQEYIKRCLFLLILFNIVLEVLARAIRQENVTRFKAVLPHHRPINQEKKYWGEEL